MDKDVALTIAGLLVADAGCVVIGGIGVAFCCVFEIALLVELVFLFATFVCLGVEIVDVAARLRVMRVDIAKCL
jgi:hypothetical protein